MKRQRISVFSSSESDSDFEAEGAGLLARSNSSPRSTELLRPKDADVNVKNEQRNRPKSKKRFRSEIVGKEFPFSFGNDVKDVRNIYEMSYELFTENKITSQNAFSLKLLDCLNEMVNSPGYDKSNMLLAASTVEISAKIYACRVDNARSQVLSLASDLSLLKRNNMINAAPPSDNAMIIDIVGKTLKKPNGITIKKRGKFVEQDNRKLLATLEQANAKFTTRRMLLKKRLDEMLDKNSEFDYLSFYLGEDDEHPLETPTEKEKLQCQQSVPRDDINCQEMAQLDFLPFWFVSTFDPEVFDVWGLLINGEAPVSAVSQLQANDEFRYDPTRRPVEDPEESHEMSQFDDDETNVNDTACTSSVSIHDIPSLDHLDRFFLRAKKLVKDKNTRYGWCGPSFVRKASWPTRKRKQQTAKKSRAKRNPKRIDFSAVDWEDPKNQFNYKLAVVYDDVKIESWRKEMPLQIPFLDCEASSYDDDNFHPHDLQNEDDPKAIPRIFQFFTMRNRNFLKDTMKVNRENEDEVGIHHHQDDNVEAMQVGDITASSIDLAHQECSQALSGPQNDDHLFGSMIKDDGSMIHFSKKPKPIDMSNLKNSILKTLMTHLKLDVDSKQPTCVEETKIDLAYLMLEVLKKLDQRTEKLLSVSIFFAALMHVLAERNLHIHIVYDDDTSDCPVLVCKGRNSNCKMTV